MENSKILNIGSLETEININGKIDINNEISGNGFLLSVLNLVYPIGSVYINHDYNITPKIILNWSESEWIKIDNNKIIPPPSKQKTNKKEDNTIYTLNMWKRIK